MGETTTTLWRVLTLLALGCAAGCSKEPPPPSVDAFMEDPILLDATMVRCVANRNSVSYDPECVNAREAVERIAAAEEKARQAALEAESERKREALRRAQEAADAARRRAEELERLRQEAELLGLAAPAGAAGTAPGSEVAASGTAGVTRDAGIAGAAAPGTTAIPPGPGAVEPTGGTAPMVTVEDAPLPGQAPSGGAEPAGAGAPEAGAAGPDPETAPVTTDLGEIREQLERRRQEAPPETS